MPRHLVRRR